MGNEKSIPVGLQIGDIIIDDTDYWVQKVATINKGATEISIFEDSVFDKNESLLLLKFSKNLMLHRHPYILRYIASWKKNGKYYVATESAKPLRQVIDSQTPLQLCVGLYNILKAIMFLHENALSSHNNICRDSIYVTTDGTWKLARMEYLCKFSNVTSNSLMESRVHRYKPAVNPNECKEVPNPITLIDEYAFNVLVQEILEGKSNDEIPTVIEFKEFCKTCVQNKETGTKSFLAQLTSHPFFTHRFIAIYLFLTELPLKNEAEKENFFKILADELMLFPEELIASQLGTLLLSRLVLLDLTAQEFLLPRMLVLKSDHNSDCLFSENVAKKYIAPRLYNVFCIRDSQIRLILLKHFVTICNFFTHHKLQTHILPELLVGVKDTNDELVEVTLRAVADLVPILGASTVIGKGRTKLFADGRPMMSKIRNKNTSKVDEILSESSIRPNGIANLSLMERPSPDGGEDNNDTLPTGDEEVESWSDWDGQEVLGEMKNNVVLHPIVESTDQNMVHSADKLSNKLYSSTLLQDDVTKLDIKCSEVNYNSRIDDIDEMFKGMEPVILKTQVFQVTEENTHSRDKFKAESNDSNDFEGWGEDISNWADIDSCNENIIVQ